MPVITTGMDAKTTHRQEKRLPVTPSQRTRRGQESGKAVAGGCETRRRGYTSRLTGKDLASAASGQPCARGREGRDGAIAGLRRVWSRFRILRCRAGTVRLAGVRGAQAMPAVPRGQTTTPGRSRRRSARRGSVVPDRTDAPSAALGRRASPGRVQHLRRRHRGAVPPRRPATDLLPAVPQAAHALIPAFAPFPPRSAQPLRLRAAFGQLKEPSGFECAEAIRGAERPAHLHALHALGRAEAEKEPRIFG